MDRIIKYLLPVFLLVPLTGCEDYLERTPDSDLSEEQVFGNYRNFQGYIDELYGYGLIKYLSAHWTASMDFGDDVYNNKTFPVSFNIPTGNYWWIWSNTDHNPFINQIKDPVSSSQWGIWDQGLINIRRANHAIENLDKLTNNTQEEYNLLRGQALFFRAWNHFEIAKFWGGLPYIDKYLEPSDDMRLERLSFRETLLRVADDLTEAADLLPVDWDQTAQGANAPGTNTGRITKGAALALKSRALLYAASPLATRMETGVAEYDLELCEEAAKAAYEVLKLANQGVYSLVPWSDYSYMFADSRSTTGVIWSDETIFAKMITAKGGGQVTNGIGRIHNSQRFGGNGVVTSPTVNFINLYETATGYAIKDAPDGDYDAVVPWRHRDPRMLKTILVDGVKWVSTKSDESAYVQLYNAGGTSASGIGLDREASGGSVTGYLIRKYIPYKVNTIEKGSDWNNFRFMCPYIRLAEMYLNYAEAVNEVYGPTSVPGWADLSAADAINTIRRRVKLPANEDVTLPAELMEYSDESFPDVQSMYLTSKEVFRDRIRNERSVELAFEGHRFCDMRRWYLCGTREYKVRYAASFDKQHTYYREEVLFEGPFDEKHYWFPFKRTDVQQYEGFQQNPGW